MIENNLLKTNFLGKDGFRWWIGQVAPEDAQGDQINQIGNTWGSRVKVRIYGYHPPNETELANDDLPWAQVLLSPQGGSGKANRARSLRISPGDIVMGFFLDGDDAQLPVILGMFANTPDYYGGTSEYTSPFEPFTGYTSKIKPNPDFIAKNEGGDSNQSSQKSPRFVTKEIVDKDGKSNTDNHRDTIVKALNNEKVTVKVQSLSSKDAPPAMILLPEQMRRINDMGAYMEQKMPGLPEYHVLLINKEHPLIVGLNKITGNKIIIDEKDPIENPLASKIANHVYDMAKLSVGGLDQEQIINLQNNNAELISELLNSTN